MSRKQPLPARFHPAVESWFSASFGQPTRAQELGWPSISSGAHTLICAPTGSGKTLTAFLWALDRLMFRPLPPKVCGKSLNAAGFTAAWACSPRKTL